ncbi:initiation factor 2B-like protein [Hippea maritima]|uniref:Initiation factor 2B related protein n=1 Tax=Hippea maritima (strain ATCC 700847 / DSM 10411 / MH2) TaxID=760142 RepID=F2LWM7_HIPMA|nr:initiation factor 2B-like protein [Hippea maritima]AEA34136.1 initiation factor 2B related protein [Hippea maritima DSM 10411]
MECVKLLKSLAFDRVSSSLSIAFKMLDCVINLCGKVDFKPFVENIMNNQPSMSVVLSVGNRVLVAKGCSEITKIRDELALSESQAVNEACNSLKGIRNIATISYSSSVLESLKLIQPSRVYLSVSHPAREGEKLAKELSELGMDVFLFEDSAYGLIVKNIDAFLIGADAVFDKAVVNKIGSLYLALLAKEFNKPFYVIANRFKRLNDKLKDQYRIVGMPNREITNLNVNVINVYFELIPMEFVNKVFSGGL